MFKISMHEISVSGTALVLGLIKKSFSVEDDVMDEVGDVEEEDEAEEEVEDVNLDETEDNDEERAEAEEDNFDESEDNFDDSKGTGVENPEQLVQLQYFP